MLYTQFKQFSTFPYAQIGKLGHLWLFGAQKMAILGCFGVHRGLRAMKVDPSTCYELMRVHTNFQDFWPMFVAG